MSLSILGMGTAVPSNTINQHAATELASDVCCENEKQRRLVRALYRMSGVANRFTCVPSETATEWIADNFNLDSGIRAADTNGNHHESPNGNGTITTTTPMLVTDGPSTDWRMRSYEEHAFPLALTAADQALAVANVQPTDVTHLVTVSCTGFYAPGVDVQLMQSLGLPSTTQRTHVGFMGCHGAINGLRTANAYATADPHATVLMCAVELCSLHYAFRWDPNRIVGNALFADGAAALVGRHGMSLESHEFSPTSAWQVAATGSCLIPNSTADMSWRIGDHGFEMTLSPQVPDAICEHLRPWLAEWLGREGYTLSDVQSWVIHPGGPRIVEAAAEALDLPAEAMDVSRQVLAEYGNMSSPTVLFILERLLAQEAEPPCLMLAFGPGLMAEGILLDRSAG